MLTKPPPPLFTQFLPLSRDHVPPSGERRLDSHVIAVAEQYFIPLEDQQLIETFVTLSDGVGGGLEAECNDVDCTDVNTFIGISILYDDTLVLWDHW